jgi:thiamine biosynthesis lipoprotein
MKAFLNGIAVLSVISLFSCTSVQKKVMFQGQTQGTYYAITYFDEEGRNFQSQADSILKAFDLSVSMWVPESVISRINSGDSLVQPDEWFIDIFKRSQEIAAKTGGAFDCTVGPLVNAWGFGFKGKIKMDQVKVDSLLQYIGYQKVSLDNQNRISKPIGVRFDFNAIAQGYAVDVLGNFLASRGINNYLIDIGGEVLGKGLKPDGQTWLVGIENPSVDSLSDRTVNTRVKLTDKALATSGSYRKYYEENGIRYSHTIDPHTGYPVRHSLLSVSVLAGDCATADGYATAFMVMGFDKAREFVENEPGLEAFFIVDGGSGIYQTYATKGLAEIIERE